jgi:hypothetical protein
MSVIYGFSQHKALSVVFLFTMIVKQETPFCLYTAVLCRSWMADQQMVIVVHDKRCRYKQSLSKCHFMSKLFPLEVL